jgi:hypothetical protein
VQLSLFRRGVILLVAIILIWLLYDMWVDLAAEFVCDLILPVLPAKKEGSSNA